MRRSFGGPHLGVNGAPTWQQLTKIEPDTDVFIDLPEFCSHLLTRLQLYWSSSSASPIAMSSRVISAVASISSVFVMGRACIVQSRTGARRKNDSRTLSGRPNTFLNTSSQLSVLVIKSA